MTISSPVFLQNANITSYLNQSHTVPHKLLKKQCQNSSGLRLCPFQNGGSYSVALCFAYNSSQYFGHAWQRPNLFSINFLTRSTIVDIQLTLTFWMGQWWCCALIAYNSCHDVRYAWQWPNLFSNTFLTRLRIANAQVRLIFRMTQWLCCFHFCLYWLSVCRLYIMVTTTIFNWCIYKTNTVVIPLRLILRMCHTRCHFLFFL